MEKIKAKVEGLLHKNEHDTTTAGTHSTTTGAGTHSAAHNTTTGAGTHSGALGDERHANPSHVGSTGHTGGLTDSTTHGSHTHGSDPTGPHDSRLGNKADPRVDSDHVGGYGNTHSGPGNTHGIHSGPLAGAGQTHSDPNGPRDHVGGLGNTHSGHGHHSDPRGPHDIPLANELDPNVNTGNAGGYGSATPYSGGLTGSSTHGTHGNVGGLSGGNLHGSDPTGPHDSRLGNKADPRVDSDHVGGYGNTAGHGGGLGNATGGGLGGTHAHGHQGEHGLAGHHDSSDRVGGHSNTGHTSGGLTGGYGNTPQTEGYGNATGGGLSGTPAYGQGEHGLAGQGSHLPGPAHNTAGPHKSDMMNKMDPRVDADLDGSKTVGGNKTYAA